MNNTYIAFGDIETGGLNGRLENGELGMEYYPIFELAFIITDKDLVQMGEPLRIVVHQTEDEIRKSHPWALETHTKSGLLDEVRQSTVTLKDAEQLIIGHLKGLGIGKYDRKTKEGAIFSGNSIMFDRSYILCQMPELNDYMHYRQLDISALALAARLWLPALEKEAVGKKRYTHKALDDIEDSIEELRTYRAALFSNQS